MTPHPLNRKWQLLEYSKAQTNGVLINSGPEKILKCNIRGMECVCVCVCVLCVYVCVCVCVCVGGGGVGDRPKSGCHKV